MAARLVRQMKTFYVDSSGKRVPKGTPGAAKKTVDQGQWYGQGLPGLPPTKRVPLATDKRVALKMLHDLETAAERGQVGLPSADLARADLAELATEFGSDMLLGLANKNRSTRKRPSQEQVDLATQRLRAVLSGCRFVTVADLNDHAPGKVARYLAERAALPRKEGGLSAQSCENYRKVIGRFAWWLSIRKKAPVRTDLFADVPAFDFKRGRVHLRRALSHAELATLLDATRSSGAVEYGLTAEDRYFLYAMAAGTGFRASELASLTPSSFRLDATPPTVAIAAKRSKNKDAAVNPIGPGLARQLRGYLEHRPAGERIWYGNWARDNKGAEILRRDLERAGIPYKVDSPEGPRYADFHSLRHVYMTNLVAAGANPKEWQTLARHADSATALEYYAHTTPEALAAAVGRLPSPGGLQEDGEVLSRLSRPELELLVKHLAGRVLVAESLNVLLGLATVDSRDTRRDTQGVDSAGDGVNPSETQEPKKSGHRDGRRRREKA